MRNFFSVELPYPIVVVTRRRFALSLFYFQLLCAPASFSQRSLTSFSALSDYHLGYRPLGMAIGPFSGTAQQVVVFAPEQPSLRIFDFGASGKFDETASIVSRFTYRSIVTADVNSDGANDFLALASDGKSLTILRKKEFSFDESVMTLPSVVQKMIAADINNDRRMDVLLFGKGSAGVLTLLAQPNGMFAVGQTLFPDISVSDLVATDLNGDRITDVLILNWLSNELTVFNGISRLVFSELVSVRLPSEPASFSMTRVSAEKSFRIAIAFPETKQIQIYSGNSLGDYRMMNSIALPANPSGVEFASVNDDEWQDIVTSSQRGIHVALATSATAFSSATTFGISSAIVGWGLADLDGDGKRECVLADRATNRLIGLSNSESSGRYDWTNEYAVGNEPEGIAVADLNGDGRQDIAIANSASATLSILVGRSRGRFMGQQEIQLLEKPSGVRVASTGMRAERTLLVSHSDADQVSVVTVSREVNKSKTFAVPTGNDPFVTTAKNDSASLQFFVRYRNTKDRSLLLSSFEQISARQFVERSYRATLPTKILAMHVDDGVSAGTFELHFATNDKSTKLTTISSSMSDGLEFKTSKPLFLIADSTVSARMIEAGFVNNDPFKDVVVVFGAPRNEFAVWFGKAPSVTRDSIEWIRNVQPASNGSLFLRDVNDDQITDITWLDGIRKAVVTMYGTERRAFRQPTMIVPAEGVSAIQLARLRENGVDVILSNTERGTVSVIQNPFTR